MIHPSAVIDPSAVIGSNVTIGPFCVVGADVAIGDNCVLNSHVVLQGPTVLGKNNHIFQFATVGEATPDLKFKGEKTRLVIGDNNVIREGVTIHRGTVQDRAETTIGNDNLIMAYAHIGHDCVVGNHCILVNNAALAGHVVVGDWAILAGYSLVHQFCQIGAHSFCGMGSAVNKDVPAYVTVFGNPAEAKTINAEGLKRRGFSAEAIAAIRKAYKIVYRSGLTLADAQQELAELAKAFPEVAVFVDSVNNATRGIVR
ncbi:MAG: UDP-N-acetylglucosamine acyltransferase [Pseudomonadota bacterium]|jgi:UDP-N-acetylglucosamine acyltransferase